MNEVLQMFFQVFIFAQICTASCPAATTPVAMGDPTSICKVWSDATSTIAMTEGTWNGVVSTCNASDMDAVWRAKWLQLLAAYRTIAGFSTTLSLDTQKNNEAQQCALMAEANKNIGHTVNSSWACYTTAGFNGNQDSGISSYPAIASLSKFMLGKGVLSLGQRRWFLSNTMAILGVGSTNRYSCTILNAGGGSANQVVTTWPPNGIVPLNSLASGTDTVDSVGWSVQSDSVDLRTAAITVTQFPGNRNLAITTPVALAQYGSAYAVSFRPNGWTTMKDTAYVISIFANGSCYTSVIYTVDCSHPVGPKFSGASSQAVGLSLVSIILFLFF